MIIKGLAHSPFATVDPRTNLLRAPALHYSNIICYLEESGIDYNDSVMDLIPSPLFVYGLCFIKRVSGEGFGKMGQSRNERLYRSPNWIWQDNNWY